MTDEPTRRMIDAKKVTSVADSEMHPIRPDQGFVIMPERPSTRPEAFSEREGPTLASPSSASVPTQLTLEQRLTKVCDQVVQMDSDLETVRERLNQLTDVVNEEQLRGRAARMGRYLLWGAIIAAMATFWMILRLRVGAQ
jgi:hypothetical protein